jgi:methionine-R-sulfoxide reductase
MDYSPTRRSNMKSNLLALAAISIFFHLLLGCKTASSPTITSNHMNVNNTKPNPYYSRIDTTPLQLSNDVWESVLDDELYEIARERGTEYAFSGKYWDYEGIGNYYCAACGNHLFKSDAKFASSCGWPSFFETIRPNSCIYKPDNSHGMRRVEVTCGRCDAHLGHIFDDGPAPTFKRYCMNSISLDFEPDTSAAK